MEFGNQLSGGESPTVSFRADAVFRRHEFVTTRCDGHRKRAKGSNERWEFSAVPVPNGI
jgi:hypothetical protein